jgi:2-keto-4-pentenoate hydratase
VDASRQRELAAHLACERAVADRDRTISTGTLTGMLRPKPGETYVADLGPFGKATATYA